MFEPVIQANDSLVLNGHFEKALEFWVRGANPREISVEGETYEENPIRVLTAGNLASVSQQFTTPVEPGPSASYVLSFLCETRHTAPGRMLITDENENLLKEIELKPSSARDLEKHLARIASKKPLVFKPIEYTVPFDLPLQRLDKVRLTIVAPRNADPQDYHLKVVITGIELALHLEPLVLQALKLDEQQLLPGGLCYLCLGAVGEFAHRLEFVPQADSPWVYTKAALVSDDNPQGAIIATPGWGVDHPLNLPWSLQCPLIGNQDPYVFPMELVNQYTAAPYPIEVSLGHHRLVFSEVLKAAYFPVRELKQSVRLGVRVASWYTGQFLAGRTVTWAIEGQAVLDTTTTDDDGWAYIDHQSEVAGDFRLVASVASPYYASGVVTTTLYIRVLETDPWKDVLAVVEGNALPWPQKTGYPNRGSTYQLNVRLPEVLRGTELALRWEGDSAAQLGVQVSPELEEPVPVDAADLSWWLNSEDKLDGRFELHLSCSKLLLPSDRKQMSLARNLVRIGDVQEANKFPVVDEHESVLLRVQVVHVVASGDGDPVINALVDWQTPEGTISTRTGRGGWASVLYKPTRAGELVVSARVRAHEDAASMERPFAVKALASSPWKGQVRILFDGTEADLAELGLLCWRGSSHTLRVEPTPGSSLLDQMVTLQWRGESPAIGLTVAGIGEPMKLEAKGLEWTFSSPVASSISSLFSLTLSSAVLNAPREMFGRLISTELMDELTVMLDQVSAVTASQTMFPCIGARHNMRYLPNALSPLVGLLANLWWQGTPADELGASVEPPIDDAQPLNDGGAGWALDFISSKVGDFTLALQLPALKWGTPANPMRLNHNKVTIEDWRESAVDAVIGQDEVWSWVKVVSAFTGQPVPQFAVEWRSSAGSATQDSDESGWSGHGYAPTTPGESEVVAQVISPFDNYEAQHRLSVVTLERDPWLDVRVRFDGHDEHPLGGHTYFPRRNGSHAIEVLFPDDSPLRKQEVSMGLFGAGPTELGLLFEPALGVPRRPLDFGLGYSLRCADLKDGAFALRLGAERLSRLSPANAMSLGIGEQIWKILASGNVQQVLEWGQELVVQVEVVSSVSGQGIAGVVVTWQMADLRTETSVTNFYGVATARFAPQTPGAAVVTATVGGAVYKESVDLPFTLQEPREIQALTSSDPIGYPGKEVSAEATVVSARTGEPLPDVEVMWDYPGIKIASTKTDANGKTRVAFRLPPVREGVLQATVRGGYGGWEMKTKAFKAKPNSNTWLQEFTLWLNGREVNLEHGKLLLLSGTVNELELRTDKFSWLIPWADVALENGSPSEPMELTFAPMLGHLRPVSGEPIRWIITTPVTPESSSFSLKFIGTELLDFALSVTLTSLVQAVAELDVYFETSQVTFGRSTLFPCLGGLHTVSLRAKADSPLLGMMVKLNWSGEPAASLDVVVTPPEIQPLIPGETVWKLDCRQSRKSGKFSLQFGSPNWVQMPLPLTLAASLAHNLVTAERWTTSDSPLSRTTYHIRTTSSFLNLPAPGVHVIAHLHGAVVDRWTDDNGEANYSGNQVHFWTVKNPYDGSSA